MAKKEKEFVIKPIVPIDTDDEYKVADQEQVNWLLAHSNFTTTFHNEGPFVEQDGTHCRIIKIYGIGAKKLSKKFAKEFGWGETDGALEIAFKEDKSAEIRVRK